MKSIKIRILAVFLTFYTVNVAAKEPKFVNTTESRIDTVHELYYYPALLESEENTRYYAENNGFVTEVMVTLGQEVTIKSPLLSLKRDLPGFAEQTISSKIGGEVVLVNVSKGQQVKPGDLLAQIINPKTLFLSIEIPSNERKYFTKNVSGKVMFTTLDEPITVTVKGVSSQLKPNTGTFSGILSINTDSIDNLYPGMIGKVRFEFNPQKALIIPQNAIFYERGKAIVRIAADNKVIKKTVILGKTLPDGMQVIESGLDENQSVIIAPGEYLEENEAIKTVSAGD